MASFLLFLCVAAGCGVIGILFMLYAPALQGMPRMRVVGSAPVGFLFTPPPPPSNVILTPTTQFTPPATFAANAFVPTPHVSTDFSVEEPVREYRLPTAPPRAKTPPPLPKAAQAVALPTPAPTPVTAPRLGVSAPSRSRHLEPPRRMPPPMPRTRSARGSDAPPPPKFSTENMRTLPHERDEFPFAEHTFVD